mgnify:CR=1 FL=1
MAQILRSEKGGYSKKDAEKAINALIENVQNALKKGDKVQLVLDCGMDSETAAAELENIRMMPIEREEDGFFARSGFSVEDTDAYFAEMEEKILNKINGEV